jgi:oxygen-independent coproporphyrinogen III oxidase
MKTMKFLKKKTELWNYPILSEHHDKIGNVNEFASHFDTISIDKPITIYVHIPYCDSFCYFCPYHKESNKSKGMDELFDCMISEIRYYSKLPSFKNVKIKSIQFGGGSPSCIPLHYIESILKTIHEEFDTAECELITMEGNVRDLTFDYLSQVKELGINRMSFGIQTFNPEIRKKIGIKSTVDDIYNAVNNFKKLEFPDYSTDLMYNLPEQTMEVLDQDLKIADSLGLTYIEAYGLNIYPNTFFEKLLKKENYFKSLPSDEDGITMFKHITEFFVKHGYNQVLGNKFSKTKVHPPATAALFYDGYALGIGPSAKSSLLNLNYRNVVGIEQYIESIRKHQVSISVGKYCDEDLLDVRRMVLLSNTLKIDKSEIKDISKFRETIDILKCDGYITEDEDIITFTELGALWVGDISNLFLDADTKSKQLKIYIDAMKYKENPYNQDKTGVV